MAYKGRPADAALHGRDFFGDVVRQCRRRNLRVLAYYSLIFDLWAFQTHPDWRIVDSSGENGFHSRRAGVVCPNSPYAAHARAMVRELVGSYTLDGIFLDMTFWPAICYASVSFEPFTAMQMALLHYA